MYQTVAWEITVFLFIIVVAVFLFVVRNSGQRQDYAPIQKKGYRIRNIYFFIVVAGMIVASYLSLGSLPFEKPVSGSEPMQVVKVTGRQFSWELSTRQISAGVPVEFQVTSLDVNHGMGIYDENMKMLVETQAMPEYTNKVYYTFTKPGKYKILCMEYCGIAHHVMIGEIEVK